MSGAVKSGLIFALVGVAAVVGLSFVPLVGPLLCGPLAAALIGTAAGYFGVRWGAADAGVGTGVLAGAIAGVGVLVGAIIFWLVAFSMVQSMPGFQQELRNRVEQQQPGAQLDPTQIDALMPILGPLVGICFGVFNLLLALALGALGGWLAARRRAGQAGPPPPPSEPFGPPPLSPTS
jgi:hypothetical protein